MDKTGSVRIEIDQIPSEQVKAMARGALISLQEFYASSANQKRYETWKKECEALKGGE